MEWAVETFNLTRKFTSTTRIKSATFDSHTPHFFLQVMIGKLTGRVVTNMTTAINDVNIKVRNNEFFGLLGPNGSGKTTLLKVLSGLLPPTSGTATVLGFDLIKERRNIINHVNYIAGLLTGGVWCDPTLSARKNLKSIASLYGVSDDKIERTLKFVGLDRVADSRVGTFSSGMAARLIVAFGLLREAPLYLMDEPTIGISVEAVREIQMYFKEYVQRELKSTVIYATNNVIEAEQLCDRVAIIHNGTVLVCGKSQDLIKSLGKEEVIEVKLMNLTSKAIETLRGEECVISVSLKEGEDTVLEPRTDLLRIRVYDSEEALPVIINQLVKKSNCIIKHVSILKPTLEDVFIHYVTRVGRIEEGQA